MSEYRLQTELNDETRREMVLHEEKRELQAEIQKQETRAFKSFYNSTKIFSFLILMNVLLSFIWGEPADFFVVLVYGVCYTAEIAWLLFGVRKRRRMLEKWQTTADEAEIEEYGNQ